MHPFGCSLNQGRDRYRNTKFTTSGGDGQKTGMLGDCRDNSEPGEK